MIILNLTSSHLLTILYCSMHKLVRGEMARNEVHQALSTRI